jgi:hypothetical protein
MTQILSYFQVYFTFRPESYTYKLISYIHGSIYSSSPSMSIPSSS